MPGSPQIFVMSFGDADITASSHPNEMKFRGVLVRLDEPSTRPPNGAEGHRIMVPTAVARKKLSTLLNMGLNYAPDMKHHAQRRKIGVITKAWIDGRDVRVEATVWKHDFPEAERDLKRSGLGMSMELGQVSVQDSGADVWVLSDFTFLGATVLERDSAAYSRTHAIAAAREKGKQMATTRKKAGGSETVLTRKQIADIAASAATEAITKIAAPLMDTQARILTRLDAFDAAEADEEIDASEEPEKKKKTGRSVDAAKRRAADDGEDDGDDGDDEDDDDEGDDDDMESEEDDMKSEVDKGDLEELGPEADAGDQKPGHANEGADNKGRKTEPDEKVGKSVDSQRLAAALSREKTLRAKLQRTVAANTGLEKRVRRLERQVTAAGDQMSRRTSALPAEAAGVLRKGGLDAGELLASGQKLTVDEVDGILQNIGGMSVEKRIQLKGELVRHNVMDEGRVTR